MAPVEELTNAAKRLSAAAAAATTESVAPPLRAVADAADEMKRSFSGSWLGYHSRVYYRGLAPAPPGAHFSQEWGLQDLSYTGLGSHGDWEEFDPEQVKLVIFGRAGPIADLGPARKAARDANAVFEEVKAEVIGVALLPLNCQRKPRRRVA
jgi:hypothetical protein